MQNPSTNQSPTTNGSFTFLSLPCEVREMIYETIFEDAMVTIKTVYAEARQFYFPNVTLKHFGTLAATTPHGLLQALSRVHLDRLQNLCIHDRKFDVTVLQQLPALKRLFIGDEITAGCAFDIFLIHNKNKRHCHELNRKVQYRDAPGNGTLENIRGLQGRQFSVTVYAEVYIECTRYTEGLIMVMKYDMDTEIVQRAFDEDGDEIDTSSLPTDTKVDDMAANTCHLLESPPHAP